MAGREVARARRWLSRLRESVPVGRSPRTALPLPQFLILGMQKSGTTWLHQMLAQHEGVFLPNPKELHFYDQMRTYREGLSWYAEHFRDAPRRALRGEATASYLWTSDHRAGQWAVRQFDVGWKYCLPERVRATLGEDVRFVVLLRDPVARAVSAFYHHLRVEGRVDPERPFEETARTWGIAHMGFYAAHLERWYEVYPPERFQVLVFEEVMASPQPSLDTVCDHLRIARLPLSGEQLGQRVHGGEKYRGADGQYYFDEGMQRVAITHDDLAMLRELYAPENRRLAQLLGRPLDVWQV